jgi:uncharacterized protein YjbI with pentapeptide repeats
MANDEDLARLRQGAAVWNGWRSQNPERLVNLRGADLRGADLRGADLRGADLREADLREANLSEAILVEAILVGANLREANLAGANLARANLIGADLRGADLPEAKLPKANLAGANLARAHLMEAILTGANLAEAILVEAMLTGANLSGANLTGAMLTGANLREVNFAGGSLAGANLRSAILIDANLTHADLTGCRVYGISAWNLKLEGAKQRDLVITRLDEPNITVDNLEVAQFIYLLLHNEKIRDVIDTITSKVVLILGRFTKERKAILDALRDILSKHDRTPVVFDFDVPNTKNVTETVKLLAQLARYVIVDLSDPNSAPYELGVISMLDLDSTPVVPLIVSGQRPFPMLADVLQKRWSTELITYQDRDDLLTNLGEKLLKPAEAKVRELRRLPTKG